MVALSAGRGASAGGRRARTGQNAHGENAGDRHPRQLPAHPVHPDLVPADLVGTRVYHPGTGAFSTTLGPVFANLLLADEINRAPAKVQSALLEVMQGDGSLSPARHIRCQSRSW